MPGEPATPSSNIQRTPSSTPGPKVREEKILVTVRVRPLSPREQAMYDLIAWDFPDEHTVAFRHPNDERPSSSFTFDRVFGPTCSTQNVYEEGAKDVALSVLTGINATIFAYGQTSSGKTFTMRGITENAIKDIYEHMKNTPQRDFVLKISALEIYNETVVDLLSRNPGPLRLLDDPEKGTIVEKLVEKVVDDSQHLKQLIGICEAQRRVGETALNDKSSRSHQIIRLTIESHLQENSGRVKSFIATLNLVDLAGSERASLTKGDGLRLKEGGHINRSLLTLTQVIRKLSGGKRSSHIPYRESKLTRILQHSLGGNARTAIICTLSPALSHVEQSRNSLSFATSAKEVTNTARVNVVVSDEQLVKHLQKEVARLEAELRSPEPSSSSSSSCLRALLMEKDLKIKRMEIEMRELKRQRDLAQSHLELERKSHKEQKGSEQSGPSHQVKKCLAFPPANTLVGTPETWARNNTGRKATLRQSITSTDPYMLMQEIRKLEILQRQLGEEANQALDVLHKEISSDRLGTQDAVETIAKLLSEIKGMQVFNSIPEEVVVRDKADLKEEIVRLNSQGSTIESLEKKLDNVQSTINKLACSFTTSEDTSNSKSQSKKKKMIPFSLSNSHSVPNFIRAPCSPLSSSRKVMDEIVNKIADDNNVVSCDDNLTASSKTTPLKGGEDCSSLSLKENTPVSRKSNPINVKKMQKMFKNAAEENIRSIRAYVTELKERVAKLQYQKQLLVCQVLELEANEGTNIEPDPVDQSPLSWHSIFEDQRKQIIMLWHLCHVSLVHRTQFYLLFRGDPADQIYMEVEIRRLTWLEQHLSELGNASPALLGDDPASYVSSSVKALKEEREFLAKRVSSKLTSEEREMLYIKWEIPPEGKQKRRLQLVNKLWNDPHCMQHVKESAEIVAKLVGFCESGEHVRKEMFELNFRSPADKKTWMGWNLISNLLHL
ncbi:hypothetical protein Nepgr_005966 [Nepenthes gracilis]|uniref:Kinesin-like protein n=1 Tax=Nepenthes gracilis TaxID=150966 RepID=A0AAD3S4M4_NEPGR|nr:hypothetical protein Nepgr_005966 [Nepenthes gracilis]